MGALLKPFSSLLLIMFSLFLIFSTIGDRAFGGLRNDDIRVLADQGVPDIYLEMNFNDLFNSFVTLFTLMVVNNWFVIVQMFENVTGTVWTRLYFVIFYFLSVIVMLNIVVAFAIDMYSSVDSLYAQKEEKKNDQRKKSFVSTGDDDTSMYSVYLNETDREEMFNMKEAAKYKTGIVFREDSDLLNMGNETESAEGESSPSEEKNSGSDEEVPLVQEESKEHEVGEEEEEREDSGENNGISRSTKIN
jgi:hypothetical protein